LPRRVRPLSRSIGGAGLAAIELGLVDEFRIFRDPVIVGGGTPFPLDLIETRTFGTRVIYERYGASEMSNSIGDWLSPKEVDALGGRVR
jgi:hypothetical protein